MPVQAGRSASVPSKLAWHLPRKSLRLPVQRSTARASRGAEVEVSALPSREAARCSGEHAPSVTAPHINVAAANRVMRLAPRLQGLQRRCPREAPEILAVSAELPPTS